MEEEADNSDESTYSPEWPEICSESSSDDVENLDRISGLPDFVLHHILSFLPMKDAVKTGVLSKRWEFLWTSVPDLDFYDPIPWGGNLDEFVNFVNRTLLLYQGSKIRKFSVHFEQRDWVDSHVDSWIHFAVRKNVEKLDLTPFDPMGGCYYELPQHLYNNACLTKLRLSYCYITPIGLISWRLLKTLSLAYTQLSDNLIQNILSGSPSLEVLDLNECRGLVDLNITSPSLKKLMIHYEDYHGFTDSDSVLEISAPNLQSLAILGIWTRRFRLMNLLCLVHATLKFELKPDNEGCHNILKELLEKLRHVKNLTIGPWCMQVLSAWELKILSSPSSKRKCLILDNCLSKWYFPGIASMLRSSPDLETLVMTFVPSKTHFYSLKLYDSDGEDYWKSSKPFLPCLLHNLKTVKIVGFVGWHHEMDLVQFLLKHAMVLEKMVIYSERIPHLRWRKRSMPEELLELLEITQKMLTFPRASPHAVILFS